jgi:hypothetical protein
VRRFAPAAPRKRAAASISCLGGLSLRRILLAFGLLNAQRYQTDDARLCVHLHLKVIGVIAPKPPLCRGLCLRRRPLALGQAPCARGLTYDYDCIAHLKEYLVAGGAAAPTPPLSEALGLSCSRLASLGKEALGRWKLPPPQPRFSLRSARLAGGSLPQAKKRSSGGSFPNHSPTFRSARVVLQPARYITLMFWGAWPAAWPACARQFECPSLSNKRRSLVCTPAYKSNWVHCPQFSHSSEGYACDAVHWRSSRRLETVVSRIVTTV